MINIYKNCYIYLQKKESTDESDKPAVTEAKKESSSP